jgi:hypothetical protein
MGQPVGWSPAEPFAVPAEPFAVPAGAPSTPAEAPPWPVERIIELGELGDEIASDRDEGPIRPPRGMALMLLAVLAGVVLFGDAPRTLLRPVLTTTTVPADFDLTGNVLYAFDSSYAPNSVTAYRLDDGRRLWRLASTKEASYDTVTQVGAQTLLAPNPCIEPEPVSTVSVDTASGRQLWWRPGVPARPISGGRLVLMSRPGPTPGCGTGYPSSDGQPTYWDAVDAATGAVAWSLPVPALTRITYDSYDEHGARWAVFVARDGTVTTMDLHTGAITGQATLPDLALPAQPTAEPYGAAPTLMVAGGRALLARRIASRAGELPGRLELTGYDLATLARRWTVRVDAGPTTLRPGFDYLSLSSCGPVLCLHGSVWTAFLDPRTGAERWRTTLSPLTIRSGRALLADPEANSTPGPPGGLTIHDVSTGALRGGLPGWHILGGDPTRGTTPVLGFTAGDRTWFASLDLGRARVAAIGSAPGWYGSCIAGAVYLACRRVDGSVRAWRAPSA